MSTPTQGKTQHATPVDAPAAPAPSRAVGRARLALAGALGAAVLLTMLNPATSQVPRGGGPTSVAPVAEKLIDAVVNISTSQTMKGAEGVPLPRVPKGAPFEDFFEDFFNRKGGRSPSERKVSSLGSGFVIDGKEGLVVTNNHVIDGADEIIINFNDGSKLKVDKVLGKDTKTDLALLKVTPKKPLPQVAFGGSTKLRVGDWVMAIGNPFGLGGSVTVGIISAKQRDINSGPYDDYLQTDAAINKGNSGGPLFNMDGEVVGVNTAIISPTGGSIGIGFAVPSDTAVFRGRAAAPSTARRAAAGSASRSSPSPRIWPRPTASRRTPARWCRASPPAAPPPRPASRMATSSSSSTART